MSSASCLSTLLIWFLLIWLSVFIFVFIVFMLCTAMALRCVVLTIHFLISFLKCQVVVASFYSR